MKSKKQKKSLKGGVFMKLNKNIIRFGIPVLALVLSFSLLFASSIAADNGKIVAPEDQEIVSANLISAPVYDRTIQTNGEATIKVKPDVCSIYIGVRTENKDSKQAQKENTEKMNKVLDFLKKSGLDEKDIKTTSYNLTPSYGYDSEKGVSFINGYIVENTVNVKIRDFSKIGEILSGASEAGANNIYNISYELSDKDAAYKEALKLAVKNSEEKAKAMLSYFDVKTKISPKQITEQSTYSEPVYPMYSGRITEAVMDMKNEPQISVGEISVKANVTVVYTY